MKGYRHYHCFEPGKSEICLKALSKALKAKYKLNYNETLPRMQMFVSYAAREIRARKLICILHERKTNMLFNQVKKSILLNTHFASKK